MISQKFPLILIIFIIILSAIVRLWQLGSDGHPLLWDEAALGYNALSLFQTGRDEYGIKLPFILKSFGDFKPGLYAYAAIPSVATFGLTEYAVRLPSALAGILVVVFIYLLAGELYPQKKISLGILCGILAIANPWLVHFSRGGWEANLNLLLTVAGIWAFLKARSKPNFLFLSAFFLGLTFLTYQSAKLFTPLILLGLISVWGRGFAKNNLSKFALAAVIFGILIFPTVIGVPGASGRLTVMSAFSYPRSTADTLKLANQERVSPDSFIFNVFHGQWLASLSGVAERYFNHFSGRFLFYEGDWDNGRLGSPYVGQFYWLDLALLVLGFIALSRSKSHQSSMFLIYWVAISPLPAALSRDVVQAVRSLNLAVPLLIIAGLGLSILISYLRRLPGAFIVLSTGIIVVFYLWNVSYYLDSYYVHAPIFTGSDWLYGYKQAVETLREVNPTGRPVVFTQKLGQPYIYVLFYNRISPSSYQLQARLRENPSGDVGSVDRFGNFAFRNIYYPEDRKLKNTFFVGTVDELPLGDIDPNQSRLVKDIVKPDGAVALRIVQTY